MKKQILSSLFFATLAMVVATQTQCREYEVKNVYSSVMDNNPVNVKVQTKEILTKGSSKKLEVVSLADLKRALQASYPTFKRNFTEFSFEYKDGKSSILNENETISTNQLDNVNRIIGR